MSRTFGSLKIHLLMLFGRQIVDDTVLPLFFCYLPGNIYTDTNISTVSEYFSLVDLLVQEK